MRDKFDEAQSFQMSYGFFFTIISTIVAIAVWVGTLQASVASLESSSSLLQSIDSRLSKIEGILEEMRR